MLASLIPLALGLVLVLAPSAIANYAPTTAACPTTFLQSTGSPKDGSQTLAAGESTYITKRRTNVVKSLWATYLSDSTSGTTGYATSSLVPRVSIAVSGGGYRSALFAAGTLSAFDSRNSSSIAPLLQLADYISGTSGGSWFVTSLAMNNMPDLFVLPCPGKQQPRWKADHSIVAPASGSLAAAEDALYYGGIEVDLREKTSAGYPTSLIDFWGRALSFHFFNSTTDSNFYNPAIPHDNALLFSDIKYTANFDSAALPYPIVVTTSRVSVDDQTDSESPFTVIPITNTQFEITPYTFGSFDPTLAAHIPVENAGTRLVNGALPSGTTKCTIGLENAGFVIGSSAALFNALDDISDANTVITDWDDFASAFDGLSSTDDSIPLVANWPNSFEGYVPTTGYTFESAGNKILELTDGGEDSQNIPLGPLLVKARAQDMILALDASADVAEAGGFWQTLLDGEPSLDGGWPAGISLSATQNRTASIHGFYDFPPVPATENLFSSLGLTTRPTFFGCNTTGNGDTSVLGNYPLIVYLPNRPGSDSSYATNTSTFKVAYSDADQLSFLEAAQTQAIRGYTTTTSGVDSSWPLALKCATVERARKRAGLSRSSKCQTVFNKCKYQAHLVLRKLWLMNFADCYADGVVESAAKTARKARAFGYPPTTA